MGDSTEPEGKKTPNTDTRINKQSVDHCDDIIQPIDGVRIVSLDKVTIEKIVLEDDGSREVLLTKTESSKKISSTESEKKLERIGVKVVSEKSEKRGDKSEKSKSTSKLGSSLNGISGSKAKLNPLQKNSQLPVLKAKKSGSVSSLIEKRISPVKLTKSSSITSINKETKNPRLSSSAKLNKVPPKVPDKPKTKKQPTAISYKAFSDSSSALISPPTKVSGLQGNSNDSNVKENQSKTERDPVEIPVAIRDDSKSFAYRKSEISRLLKPRPASSVESTVSQRPVSVGEPVKIKSLQDEAVEVNAANFAAQTHLRRSQSKIEELQRGLRTKINASTAETYKQRLPSSQSSGVKTRLVKSLDLNENVTKEKFDEEFLKKHNFDKQLKIEEKRVLETDLDYVSDAEKTETRSVISQDIVRKADRREYSKTVSEIEKRWSGEFLEGHLDHNSSESSKSSYIEELGSISSHEDIVADSNAKFIEEIRRRSEVFPIGKTTLSLKSNPEELLEDTVSTVGSNSFVEDRIKDIDDEVDVVVTKNEESNDSKDSTLKESSSSTVTTCSSTPNDPKTLEKILTSSNTNAIKDGNLESLNNLKNNNISRAAAESVDVDNNNVEASSYSEVNQSLGDRTTDKNVTQNDVEIATDFVNPDRSIFDKDGYADLIKTFTMEAGTSKAPKEEKKRKGFRRLLPGLFSPKDSRKEYKKEQKERKKREEKQFGQYQQNGNYTRSPDTMNLNEDIKRNVKLNTSLNSSIIEERLNEIKQELFPEQGLTTSTPDHFLQAERSSMRPNSRNQRFYTADSSLSSIAPEDKWMDQNIISGSPDMRNLKQRKPEIDPKCSLERKHSLQEPQGRFFRNHGPSGRTSAPPGERFLIRPRAVHPVDRPLPAIPQKVEFSNYENHHEMQKYPREPYARQALDYQENGSRLQYDDRNNLDKSEQNRNHSIDSGFNLTPVSAQVKITRQPVINQNQKAPLVRRSPKYSPSSSQKSGDYADSSYTPNSSQKSEFSPSSSKSGEYYLNSPRTSVQTSPNDSLTDKREQIYENNLQSPKIPYPISPNVKIQNRIEPVYDVSPVPDGNPSSPDRAMSPVTYDDTPTTPRNFKPGSLTVLPLHTARDTPEPIYVQRSSPHIPISANLAKLSAHAEDAPLISPGGSTVAENHPNRRPEFEAGLDSPLRSMDNSPRNRTISPVQNNSPAFSRSATTHVCRTPRPTVSPTQRLASPLTVLPLDVSISRISPDSPVVQMRTSVSPLARPMSPCDVTPNRVNDQLRTPTTSPRMNETRQRTPVSGPYVPMASRRSQPSEQILIASPKRDAFYEPQVRRPTNTRMTEYSASPVPMTDSPNIIVQSPVSPAKESMYDTSGGRTASPRSIPGESPVEKQVRTAGQSVNIQRPEPIYGQRTVSPVRNQEYVYGKRALSPSRGQEVYNDGESRGSTLSSPRSPAVQVSGSLSQNPRQDTSVQRPAPRTQQSNLSESQQSIYSTRQTSNPEAVYSQGPSRQPSPSKRQTMQHLEAFYWQQKALESQRKMNSSPSTTSRQIEPRIDHPEIREAMYWQQLKKLDEEQQRRIYQQNVPDERNDPLYWRRKLQSPPTSPTTVPSSRHSSSPSLPNQSYQTGPETTENIYWRSKLQQPKTTAISKPPIMVQKGQNQPVLVVRPQPVYQEKDFDNREIYSGQREAKRDPPPRSKSASPLFARGEERRSLSLPRKIETDDGGFLRGSKERNSIAALRKTETPPIYEEDTDQGDKKPPPIFKRGSLISNSSNSVDYGTGQKRVSFSNQTTKADIGTGIWPTKHGMAPEPPTRQHRVDRVSTTSDSDSVFIHDVENQNNSNTNVYGNVLARSLSQTDSAATTSGTHLSFGTNPTDYDADRPLPPPPREPLRLLRRSNSVRDQPRGNKNVSKTDYVADVRGKSGNNPRRWPAVSESESGSEAGEIQRILRRRNEEEWNPDGKGRQSNDTENAVDEEVFNGLEDSLIKDLVPQVGYRVKFIRKYKDYLASIAAGKEKVDLPSAHENPTESQEGQTESQGSTDSVDNSASPVSTTKPCFDRSSTSNIGKKQSTLEPELNASTKGKAILAEYRVTGELNKSKIADFLINRETDVDPDARISAARFTELSEQIAATFKNETKFTFYTPWRKNASGIGEGPSGVLYTRYTNRRRVFRDIGLITNSRSKATTTDEQDDPEVDDAIAWLKNNLEPLTEVQDKWKLTCQKRIKLVKDLSLEEYYEAYKCLMSPTGYVLLDLDFETLHEGYSNKLFTDWPALARKLITIASKRKEQLVKDVLNKYKDLVSKGGSGRGEGEGGTGDLPGGGGRRVGVAGVGGGVARGTGGGGGRSRDEPRRHTLSGDHQPSLHHQQFNSQLHPLHPHHLPPPHGRYGTPSNRHATTMDLEMGTKSRQRKSPLPRGYPPPSTAMLFDDDPGIMSEVETSSTGFRRGGKQRSSLPVVRTPSKTLERPLGLVFLQYRNETKRALLPNEITSIDTVKALFVRSFPKQLTMEYLDSPLVKVYIHDSNKDMFYELEDMRSHLRDIRDRSVLRLFESSDGVAGMPGPLGAPGGGGGLPPHWEDQSYFSEPEFDSEYQHQHIHKSKTAKNSTSGSGGYYMGGSSTLPRGGPLLRAYSPAASSAVSGPNANSTQSKALGTPGGSGVPPAKPLRSYQCGKSPLGTLGGSARFSRDSSVSLYSIPDRLHGESGYMSSPERSGGVGAGTGRYPAGPYSTGSSYEDPYYSQYSGTVTPVIDEEASDTELLEESYSLYGVKPPGRPPTGPPRSPFPPGAPTLTPGGQPYDATRIRVEHMERQLANLTGLVQKALTHAPHASPSPRDYLQVPAPRDPYRTAGAGDEFDKHSSSSSASLPDDSYLRTDVKPPKLGKDKSVSFEKSVSFSDEPPDMNSPKQHSPQHAADTKPTKPAIKSSTLPRMSSQERERHKPTPPPKPATLAAGQYVYRDLTLTPEMYNQLRGLQKKAKDLRQEVRNLRRMSQAQAHTVRETIRDTFITIRAVLLSGGDAAWAAGDTEKVRLNREEDLYKQEMIRLEKDLTELESTVEELRGNVINRKTRVNMSDVENMALILNKSSKTVADLKVRFPSLQEGMKGLLSSEMEKVVREEKFLKEEPERLESALRRCKKLTGTLVTLKRLASVQEQRLPNAASVEAEETPPITPTSGQHSKTTAPTPAERTVVGSASVVGGGSHTIDPSASYQQRPENALDALLDELQTFSRPASQLSQTSSISYAPNISEIGRSASQISQMSHAPSMSDIGRKGSIDSSTNLAITTTPGHTSTLRRLHSYPSSSDTDTSPPIARLQVSDGSTPPQKPPVPERNAELLQLATARRVPPPPPPRTSSRSPLASPTSPQLPPRNPTGTLRRGRSGLKESGKPPMALPPNANQSEEQLQQPQIPANNILSASNSSSCESINSQEGLQNKKGRQEQLEQRHQELLRKQKALQEQYARLQQLQRNASGLTTVPPAPPDLLKKTGSESNLLAKMGLGLSTANSGSLTSLASRPELSMTPASNAGGNQTTTNKIYETDIL